MKASPADQLQLLDLADIDRRMKRAEAARSNPPQATRVKELIEQRNGQGRELVARTNARDDVLAELRRVEADIEVARKRRARDEERLTQTAIARDALALQEEIAALGRRIDDLETAELELMERRDVAEAELAEQQALMDATTAEGRRLSEEAKRAVADAERELGQLTRDREALATALPAALRAEYDRLAARGTGAALFTRTTCGGCRIALSPSDIAVLRATPKDELAYCPECGTILVRTNESGLEESAEQGGVRFE
ncbi:DNA-binding protein [Microbacterium sediminis]|nr:DNA-binding protein [Microbacterium sediminis]